MKLLDLFITNPLCTNRAGAAHAAGKHLGSLPTEPSDHLIYLIF